ncbi:MAG: hypothetical protein ABSE82_08880 [Nitrososphaerales archaeon]
MKAAITISVLIALLAIAVPSLVGLHSQAMIGVTGKPLAQSGTTTTVSCSAAPGQEYLCNAVVCICVDQVSTFATGSVLWSTSGTGSFLPSATCEITVTSDTLGNCEVYYLPSATDVNTQVTITAAYSGDPENSGSSGSTTINVTPQLSSTSSSIASSTQSTTLSTTTPFTATSSITIETSATSSVTLNSNSSSIFSLGAIAAVVIIIIIIVILLIRRRMAK